MQIVSDTIQCTQHYNVDEILFVTIRLIVTMARALVLVVCVMQTTSLDTFVLSTALVAGMKH